MRSFAHEPRMTQPTKSANHSAVSQAHVAQVHDPNSILSIQRMAGNQALLRLLKSNAKEQNPLSTGTATPFFGHDFRRIPLRPPMAGAIQTKLAINRPGDEYEQEADRVAEQVMHMPDPGPRRPSAETLQRQVEDIGEDDETLQRDTRNSAPDTRNAKRETRDAAFAPSIVDEVLRTAGLPLDAAIRAFMEPRLGCDLGAVRIHTDVRAAASAEAVTALAYTVGNNVVFGAGQYQPSTAAGTKLLAHELAHVLQQTGGAPVAVQRAVSNDLGRIRANLSRSLKDWAVRDYEVREVLALLKPLSDKDLRDTLAALGEKLTDRIYSEVSDEDAISETDTLARVRRLRPGRSLLAYIPSALVCAEPSRGPWEMARVFKDLDDMVKTVDDVARQTPPPAGPRLFAKLGILAHGDRGGVIQIGTTIVTNVNVHSFDAKFASIRELMTADGTIYIFGCVSAVGRDGSSLLKALSLLFPGRRIVGFNTITSIAEGEAKEPDKMCYWPDIRATDIKSELVKDQIRQRIPANESAPQAKVALNGTIIKWPSDEDPKRDDDADQLKTQPPRQRPQAPSPPRRKERRIRRMPAPPR